MATTATVTDKKAVMRDKRAQGIAAMGLVNREGDRFRVTTPSLRGRRVSYEVWRDETGKVRCSCLEFEENSTEDANFRCEHILAVKHSLLQKNSEPTVKPQPAAAPDVLRAQAPAAVVIAETTTTTSDTQEKNASERHAGGRSSNAVRPAATASKTAPRFVREQNESTEVAAQAAAAEQPLRPHPAEASSAGSLAKHNTEEEYEEMSKQNQQFASTEVSIKELSPATAHDPEAEETGAPVVPLAFSNTLRTLRQPIDARLVKTREGWTDRQGNIHMVEYVEWHTVADLLDRVVPTWSHSVRNITQIGDMIAVTAAITIDGVTREGVGTGTADNETGIKKAEHDALKRAAIKFGIARDLYQRESDVIETQGVAPQAGEFPRDPLAKSMADLVTPKQLGMIRALAREIGVDAEEECQAVLRCRTEELSKRAASSFIDHLKKTQQEAAATPGGIRRAS